MGEIKEIFSKAKKKKWGKEEGIILILAGIFLLIVFFPDSKAKETSSQEVSENSAEQSRQSGQEVSYKTQMEEELEEVLKSIDGIDMVKVMITLETSEEDVVLKESKNVKETTVEEDSQGGTREINSTSVEETVCYGEALGESTGPYVTYTIAPKVEGVLIVVGGNQAGTLRTQIVKAVQALFDVESHKVVVIKMKES